MSGNNKPKRGILTKAAWYEGRIKDLARAIHEHAEDDVSNSWIIITEWVDDLAGVLRAYSGSREG